MRLEVSSRTDDGSLVPISTWRLAVLVFGFGLVGPFMLFLAALVVGHVWNDHGLFHEVTAVLSNKLPQIENDHAALDALTKKADETEHKADETKAGIEVYHKQLDGYDARLGQLEATLHELARRATLKDP